MCIDFDLLRTYSWLAHCLPFALYVVVYTSLQNLQIDFGHLSSQNELSKLSFMTNFDYDFIIQMCQDTYLYFRYKNPIFNTIQWHVERMSYD